MTCPPIAIGALLRETRRCFAEAGIETPEIDARTLLLETLGLTLTDLVSRSDEPVAGDRLALVRSAVDRRLTGEPVHRILGRRAFYGLDLHLSDATLEPRPDTEILVDALRPHVERTIRAKGSCSIVDLGTGTGAIVLALVSLYPEATGVGVDIAPGALATARANAGRLGLGDRFKAIESDWFSRLEGRFDIIVSNPPYIRSGEMESLSREVRAHDPALALDGGFDGLDAYRILARDGARHLDEAGCIAVEIGHDQRGEVIELFERQGFFALEARADLGGRDRVLVFGARGAADRGGEAGL